MDDHKIIELYFSRNERAIHETKHKYGRYCKKIAVNILKIRQDVEECENDTYMKVWSSIPPSAPKCLKIYIGTVTRNLAIQRYRYYHADKRNQHMETVMEELESCVATLETVETEIAKKELIRTINYFLSELGDESRMIFVRRYWKMESIQEICGKMKLSKSKVETNLSRTRKRLKVFLEQEGYEL